MLDDHAPLTDDDIDDILDAMGSFGGVVTQAISKPLMAFGGVRADYHLAVSRETIGDCTVLRPSVWRR
jgi:hypothetical protein